MINKQTTKTTLAAAVTAVAAVAKADAAAVDKAFETLKTYDWGDDRETLNPIDEAIIATHGDEAAREALEKRLIDTLTGGISRSALDFVCRKLRTVGTAQSVPALAALLADEETSHIARYALERIPDAKAAEALRDKLPRVNDKLKPGLIGSLGTRRDTRSITQIANFADNPDLLIARAAVQSLGLIGTPGAARALGTIAKKAPDNLKMMVADARLVCAERLLADGAKTEAIAVYTSLNNSSQPTQVRTAAMKGMLAASTKK